MLVNKLIQADTVVMEEVIYIEHQAVISIK